MWVAAQTVATGLQKRPNGHFLNLVLFSVAVFDWVFPSWLDCSLLCSLNSFCLFFSNTDAYNYLEFIIILSYNMNDTLHLAGRGCVEYFPPPQKQTIVTSGQELWLEPFLLFLNTPPLPSHFHRTQCDCAEHTLIISQTFRHLRQLPDFFNSHTSLKARGGLSY